MHGLYAWQDETQAKTGLRQSSGNCARKIDKAEHMSKHMIQLAVQCRRQAVCMSCYNKNVIMCVGCNQKRAPSSFNDEEMDKNTAKVCKACVNNYNKECRRRSLDKQVENLQKLECGACTKLITETKHMFEQTKRDI